MDKQLSALQATLNKTLDDLVLGEEPTKLYDPMHYILSLGGKRLRPLLALLSCGVYGAPERALNQAIAIELFHNFSLIHDDIMDNAPLRRGAVTVHEKWNTNIGILSGDGMLVKAYQYMAKADPQYLAAVMEVFSQTALEVCEGQQMDMDFETREEVSQAEYIQMIQFKTSVLLGCALKIGALVGGASGSDSNLWYQFGLNLGTSFQIMDDYLDVYGDPEKFGKQVGGDIKSNKKTLLWIWSAQEAKRQGNDEFARIAGMEGSDQKVAEMRNLYTALGTDNHAKTQMDHYYSKAMTALDQLSVAQEKLESTRAFADWLMNREH